jgi:hypothetical protein
MKLHEMIRNLQEPIPRERISTKTLKGNAIDYVAWYDLVELLNQRIGFDGWNWEIEITQIGNQAVIIGKLTIFGENGTRVRESSGIEDIDCSSFGDPSSNAEAMALRRCCAKFGLGLDLWRKGKPSGGNSSGKGEISKEEWLKRRGN